MDHEDFLELEFTRVSSLPSLPFPLMQAPFPCTRVQRECSHPSLPSHASPIVERLGYEFRTDHEDVLGLEVAVRHVLPVAEIHAWCFVFRFVSFRVPFACFFVIGVWGSGLGFGFRVSGFGFRVQCLGFGGQVEVQILGFGMSVVGFEMRGES